MTFPRLYLAGSGMVTPVGANVQMTSAAVNAGINVYEESRYYSQAGKAITMTEVPAGVFQDFEAEIDEGDQYSGQYDRIIKMAVLAIEEACESRTPTSPVPLILAMPELNLSSSISHTLLARNLATNCPSWITPSLSRALYTGRASGIDSIAFAFNYLYQMPYEYLLVGGSDSHSAYERIRPLDAMGRLKTIDSADSFVPGEGACFLLLTTNPALAEIRDGHMVALSIPGLAEEKGHLLSEEPYRGDGLDAAFKKALQNQSPQVIQRIYSSMNGEHHWAKEYGVAYIRNKGAFLEDVSLIHPADCYGDLGSATATALIALAAEHLHKNKQAQKYLVYSSSDSTTRGAIIVEKLVASTPAIPAIGSHR